MRIRPEVFRGFLMPKSLAWYLMNKWTFSCHPGFSGDSVGLPRPMVTSIMLAGGFSYLLLIKLQDFPNISPY